MYCRMCGTFLKDSSKFCSKCGAEVFRKSFESSKNIDFKQGEYINEKNNKLSVFLVFITIIITLGFIVFVSIATQNVI